MPEEKDPLVDAPTPADDAGASGAGARPAVDDGLGEPSAGPADGGAEPPAGSDTVVDYREKWLRAEAELQNFRRRASREWEEGRRRAEEAVLLEMVSVLDDLERALAAAGGAGATPAWSEGVALVAQRIRDVLGRQGVTVEDPLGRRFDPAFHEALIEMDAPEGAAPGTVVQVVHKGYRRGDRALRAARVVVARAPGGSAG